MKPEDSERESSTNSILRRFIQERVYKIVPYVCFGLVVVVAVCYSNRQTQTQVPLISFGAPGDQVILQQKNPRSNKMRKIQLAHTLENARRHRQELEAARQAVACDHSEENRQKLIFWQAQCREDRHSYAIIAAETDDSLFAQTHLPRQLPY